ncbi:FAD binding domain-containing protein [Hyaloscypha variabilis F]|uniref:FAD binding domain-containing protein n=1 Tax=Hyaloscypha variabilis (strain UAMH 11265 / GT02V1 / F) TaxID=1149755 RepID=A0A2J6S1W8_HYAVF|nr:FAD binding domain-containing protein [Hyaloscypha variabilis F]
MYLLQVFLFSLVLGSACVTASDQAILHKPTDSSCHNACAALASSLGPLVHHSSPSFYTAQQSSLVPACVFTPTSPRDLSAGLQIIKSYDCHFAVRSGGHGISAGWSNSDGGVTIDLGSFNSVELLKDESEGERIARVGTGARWGDVYAALEPFGVAPVGGRSADVGVGGFILGGGISHLSRRYGWAMDNVKNFEVVLANGSIANINLDSAPDLFWALRGGGNNFGIVTRFDLQTYPQGPGWGGYNFHLMSHHDVSSRLSLLKLPFSAARPYTLNSLIDKTTTFLWRSACWLGFCLPVASLFSTFQNSSLELKTDPYAHMLIAFVYAADVNLHLGCSVTHYTTETGGPSAFSQFSSLPKVYSSLRNTTLRDSALEDTKYNQPGSRNLWLTSTFILNSTLISHLYTIFLSEIPATRSIKSAAIGLNFQPLSHETIKHFRKNGGNPLGLEQEEEPLMIVGYVLQWKREEDDEVMHKVGERILGRAVEEAKRMGLWRKFVYMNYAGSGQDVFGGYGEGNWERLREVGGRWDPEGVFTRLQPGGFKI